MRTPWHWPIACSDALEAGDLDAVSACYADDVAVWANYDDRTLDKATSLRAIALAVRQVGRSPLRGASAGS